MDLSTYFVNLSLAWPPPKPFTFIPDPVIDMICRYLDIQDILSFRLSCKSLSEIIKANMASYEEIRTNQKEGRDLVDRTLVEYPHLLIYLRSFASYDAVLDSRLLSSPLRNLRKLDLKWDPLHASMAPAYMTTIMSIFSHTGLTSLGFPLIFRRDTEFLGHFMQFGQLTELRIYNHVFKENTDLEQMGIITFGQIMVALKCSTLEVLEIHNIEVWDLPFWSPASLLGNLDELRYIRLWPRKDVIMSNAEVVDLAYQATNTNEREWETLLAFRTVGIYLDPGSRVGEPHTDGSRFIAAAPTILSLRNLDPAPIIYWLIESKVRVAQKLEDHSIIRISIPPTPKMTQLFLILRMLGEVEARMVFQLSLEFTLWDRVGEHALGGILTPHVRVTNLELNFRCQQPQQTELLRACAVGCRALKTLVLRKPYVSPVVFDNDRYANMPEDIDYCGLKYARKLVVTRNGVWEWTTMLTDDWTPLCYCKVSGLLTAEQYPSWFPTMLTVFDLNHGLEHFQIEWLRGMSVADLNGQTLT